MSKASKLAAAEKSIHSRALESTNEQIGRLKRPGWRIVSRVCALDFCHSVNSEHRARTKNAAIAFKLAAMSMTVHESLTAAREAPCHLRLLCVSRGACYMESTMPSIGSRTLVLSQIELNGRVLLLLLLVRLFEANVIRYIDRNIRP